MVKGPVVTILAMLEPETSPVAPLDTTAALAGPPLYLPSKARASLVKKLRTMRAQSVQNATQYVYIYVLLLADLARLFLLSQTSRSQSASLKDSIDAFIAAFRRRQYSLT